MDFAQNLGGTLNAYCSDGAFLTAKSPKGVNTMTVAWGFIGFMWDKPCFIAVVRPSRHTIKILDEAKSFTISVPIGAMKDALVTCGTKSGANFDKSAIVSFEDARVADSPVVGGCTAYYECRLMFSQPMDFDALPDEIKSEHYSNNPGECHIMYFGEIINSYEK